MKHWWNVSGTSPSGLKHNYVWHIRQMLYALIPPTVALLTLEACSRWQKSRSAAAIRTDKQQQQEPKAVAEHKDGSNIAHRHQKAIPKQQQSSPVTNKISPDEPDKQHASRWTVMSLAWWKGQVTKFQDMRFRGQATDRPPASTEGTAGSVATPDTQSAATTKPQNADKVVQQEDSSGVVDPAVLARLNALESELSLLRQQVTSKTKSHPAQSPSPLPVAGAADHTDTTQPTTELSHHHRSTGPLMWTSLSFLLILCRLWTSQAKFEPYVDNGGTVVGITGRNYAIIASDTRLSESYFIRSRNISKIFEVTNGVYLAASGCLSDTIALSKVMQTEMKMYEWQNERKPTTSVLAHCLANILYSRRNFPYFSVCAVAGLDDTGGGALYRYDAVGSFERVRAVCAGKGERLIQPILDEITGMEEDEALFLFPGQLPSMPQEPTHPSATTTTTGSGGSGTTRQKELDVEEACEVIVTAFKAAAEREISIGDGIDLCIIRSNDISDDDRDTQEQEQEQDQDQESMSIMSGAGDTMVGETADADDQPMTDKTVARTLDQRPIGTTTTKTVNRRTQRVSIERRSFSLPRH